jgi:hypothetical protein
MEEIKFDRHWISARKDLLHFIEETEGPEVYEQVGGNPRAWIDELNIVNQILTGHPITGGCIDQPPEEDPDFRRLGEDTFLYRGEHGRLRGLWTRKDGGKELEDITGNRFEWTQYKIGSRGTLAINRDFSTIPIEQFLPENFEQIAAPVEKEKGPNKRPLFTFPINLDGREITVYAKGADVSPAYLHDHAKPGYRLTPLYAFSKTPSKKEMDTTLKLRDFGVNVPRIVGSYETALEEFLFMEKVMGEQPDKMFQGHRADIIKQDAEMLAALCLAGYRKIGFTDFDDKIYDGKGLYLIDVDECRDLYFCSAPDFRKILLNPRDTKDLRNFRKLQRNVFTTAMRDAIYSYQDSLMPADSDKESYVSAFHERLGWKKPNKKDMGKLLDFPENYTTTDNYISMMCDTD